MECCSGAACVSIALGRNVVSTKYAPVQRSERIPSSRQVTEAIPHKNMVNSARHSGFRSLWKLTIARSTALCLATARTGAAAEWLAFGV